MSIFQAIISLTNDVLQSSIVIFGAAIVLYNLPYFLRDRVTRAFSLLTTFVVIVYTTELIVGIGIPLAPAEAWLRAEWVGIAHVPAALLHLSDVILISTGSVSNRRRYTVYGAYFIGTTFMLIAILTDWLVGSVIQQNNLIYLEAGFLFPIFTAFFVAAVFSSKFTIKMSPTRRALMSSKSRCSYPDWKIAPVVCGGGDDGWAASATAVACGVR